MVLIIMDTFKWQNNDNDGNCGIVMVPCNFTNKFQQLHITINKAVKCFISGKYNKWFSEKVVNQLNEGKNPTDFNVTLKLSGVRPLHASVQMSKHLETLKDLIFNCFELAGISKARENFNELSNYEENPFRVLYL